MSTAPAWATALLVLAGAGTWQLIAWGWRRLTGVRVVTITRTEGEPPVVDLVDLRPMRTVLVDAQGRRWVLVRSTYRNGPREAPSLTLDLADEAELRRYTDEQAREHRRGVAP